MRYIVQKFGGFPGSSAKWIEKSCKIIEEKYSSEIKGTDNTLIVVVSAPGRTSEKCSDLEGISTKHREYFIQNYGGKITDALERIHSGELIDINLLIFRERINQIVSGLGLDYLISENGEVANLIEELEGSFAKEEEVYKQIIGKDYARRKKVIEESGGSIRRFIRDNLLSLNDLVLFDKKSSKAYSEIVAPGEQGNVIVYGNFLLSKGLPAHYHSDPKKFGFATTGGYKDADIDPASNDLVKSKLSSYKGQIVVLPGFIGYDFNDESTTTLGRGGSDLTATKIAQILLAEYVELWSNKAMCRVNPELISEPEVIRRLTYREGEAFSILGAGVILDRAIEPAELGRIPIIMKDINNPYDEGTRMTGLVETEHMGVKAIACVPDQYLLTIRKRRNSLLDPFNGLRIKPNYAADGGDSVTYGFGYDNDLNKLLEKLQKNGLSHELTGPWSRIAIIGEGMKGRSGIMNDFVATFASLNISIKTILQVGDEVHMSTYVPKGLEERTVRGLYETFFENNK